MDTKVLVIGVIKNGDKILLRKKPAGSPPYIQTWYLFGGELTSHASPEETIQSVAKEQAGIEIRLESPFSWDVEVKPDHDGITKLFVYLDAICQYTNGELKTSDGIERLEWVEISRLHEYDHVPPSVTVFKKLGYLE